ncbi:MAG: hypothetical protein KGQ36_05615 [Rickettsiales bacterium]|nr:hypothetical protein [Rickettsiales bacterium]
MGNKEILKRAEAGVKEGNKVLIRELVNDLEEKGIFPAWAIGGKVRKLRLINQLILKRFEKELKKFAFKKSDFCFLEEDIKKTHSSSKNKIIILIHKESAKVRQYKNSKWIADFRQDLEDKIFTI